MQSHPWFARLAFSRPPLGPHALALYDAALAWLDRVRPRRGGADWGRPRKVRYPHFIRWANDPRRLGPAPQSFERILEWLLDGIKGMLPGSVNAPGRRPE